MRYSLFYRIRDTTDSWTTATGGNACAPVGGSALAFVTQVTNHLSHVATTKYSSCSSMAASTTDPNNQTTSIAYDVFDRPVSTTRPDGGSTTWAFDDPNRKAISTLTIGNGVSPVIAEYHYDGLWRVFESRLTSDPQGTVYTVVEFDALGRTKKAWNPTRCSSPKTNNCESTWGITEFVYDELGRTTKVIPPDGTAGFNHVATSYSGNSVTVTDQAGRMRRSYTDALGRLIEVHEPTGGSNPTAGTGSSTVSGSLQTISATPGTGSSTISGSLQTIGGTPASPGTGSATVAGSVQTIAPIAGTGSATVGGSEQSIPATQSTGWVDITGTEQSVTVQEYVGDECVMYGEFGCEEWQPVYEWVSYWDSGGVSITVNGLTKNAPYWQGSTGNSVANALANAINGDSGYPVTASVSGIRINLTSKSTGAATNYSLSVTSWTDDPGHFSGPSFVPVRSGVTMTGGANTIYDTGGVWVTVNGATKTVNYGQGSTATSVATALRDAINADGGYPVSANLSGSTVNLTAKSVGAGTNYSLSKGSSTSQPGNFASPSFSVSTSGSALTGGADTIYDSGSVWVTVNGLTKSVNYSQGSSSSSVASALVTTINADAGYPVSAGLSGSTVNLTSKSAGGSTNYSLTKGSSTSQPGNFAGPSFNVSTSGSTLSGGSNGTPDIYDTGSAWVTVNGATKSVNYGQGSTSSSVATALRDAINADGGYPATAALNGTTVNLTARTSGAATNYSLTAGSSTCQPGSFSQPSFAAAVSGANLTGGADTVYNSGNVWVTVGGFQAQVNYGQGSTASSVASAIANILNTNGSSPVTASPSGGGIALTAKVVGSISNYSLSAGSSTTSGSFANSSFPVSVSESALTGGADPSPGSLATPAVTTYSYDALDNLLTVVQSGSRQRTFTYNSLSQLLTASNPESGAISYTYDNDGNLLTKTDARGITTTHAYDGLHRLNKKTYSDATPLVRYAYDGVAFETCNTALSTANAIGRRTAMCDAAGSESWAYDLMGRLVTDRRTTNGMTRDFAYQYNLNGSLWKLTYPSGRIITYSYNPAARLTAAQDVAGGVNYATGASYAAGGALASLTNGASIVSTYYYNNRLQPCRISVKSSGTAPSNCIDATNVGNILDFGYGFTNGQGQNNGNVVSIANNRDTNRSQSFTYDELNRIKTAQSQASSGPHDWGLSFGYDIWANLLSATVTKGNDVPMLSQSVATNNRLSGYSYDAAGNMLSDGSFSYTWDAESRMKTGAGVTYTYDGDGRRVKKSNGKLYWYGPGLDALLETDLAGNNPDEYIFFGGKRTARRQSSGTVSYYFSDHLGSSRVVASAAGAILDDSDFYPFGGERIVTGGSVNHYKFTGKERDAESGLDYFIARYYASQQGRFLSPDEFTGGPVDAFSTNDPLPPGPLPYADIANPQSLNKYAYTLNNPLRYVDPDGHGEIDFWIGVAQAVVSNFALGAGREEAYSTDNAAGQTVGDAISVVGGVIEMVAGGTSMAGGVAACGTGALCVAGAPAVAAGAAIGAHGVGVAGTAASNLIDGVIQRNKHGSKGAPDHQQTAKEEAKRIGGRQKVTVQTPGGEKGSRRIDAARVVNEKVTKAVQVIRPNKNGTPPAREVRAAQDIQKATGVKPKMVPVSPLKEQ